MKHFVAFLSCLLASAVAAQGVDYSRDVKPLFAEKCSSCHGAFNQEAGLRLDHGGLLRRGGDGGSVINHDAVMESALLRRVSSPDTSSRMPPEGEGDPLSDEQIRLITSWIRAGAQSPADEAIPASPDRHWAWQIPVKAVVPRIGSNDWSQNPIDAFIYEKLRKNRIEPLPRAHSRTRLRRIYIDLIGLPPTPEQQRAFLADSSSTAWSDVVDQLLDDPAFGQRWARHWMDVWRYSDWDGFKNKVRGSQRHIWRWRDWIVQSLNADKGYDQMVVEMLAGDEVAPTDSDVLRATGFLARNYHHSNRNIWLDATVEHTAKAFLAITINCARCHDHKYDPIGQREYYAFRAIFEPHQVRTDRIQGQGDINKDGMPRVFDASPDQPTYVFLAGDEKMPDEEHPVLPATPEILAGPLEITPVELPALAVFPSLRAFVEQEDLAAANKKLIQAKSALAKLDSQFDETNLERKIAHQAVAAAEADMVSLRARWAADKARFTDQASERTTNLTREAALMAEHRAKLENALLTQLRKEHAWNVALGSEADDENERTKAIDLARKELDDAKKKLQAAEKMPAEDAEYTSVGTKYPPTSTGRRLALARWMTRPDNPLTARVAVNYVWMHHFGEPLVENVFDFGLRSPEPPHLALLDWLAVELVEHQWSMKHLHRLITTSRTYQLASYSDDRKLVDANRRVDPDNRLLWRANVRRLDAEVIRDSLLHVAGKLDRAHGGPDIDFQKGETAVRRSLYFRHAYEKQMTMLVVFDAAGPTECYRRSQSIIPQQALALSNSPLALDQARELNAKLSRELGKEVNDNSEQDDISFIRAAFDVLLCRSCTDDELKACIVFLADQTSLLSNAENLTKMPSKSRALTRPSTDPAQRARENLIHTLMNHNDFVTLR